MSASNVAALHRIARKFDRQAISQLRAEVARLSEENDTLRNQYCWADDAARGWQDDAMAAQDRLYAVIGSAPGLTMDGRMVTIEGTAPSAVMAMAQGTRLLAAAVMSPFEGASAAGALDAAKASVVDLLETIHHADFVKAGPVVTLSAETFEHLMKVVDRVRGVA